MISEFLAEDNSDKRVSDKRISDKGVSEKHISDKNISIEEAFAQLDALITELEKPDSSLEASFQAFEQGMKLVKYCNDAIDKVEKKVLILGQEGELDEF
ncbi:MAG: exodeoxyribonuclease VII small subunit [Lachnospiraceae bacterium]|nr:exodeoxyribonuclease VII small subunit [Lachnospiraceae bacterium]